MKKSGTRKRRLILAIMIAVVFVGGCSLLFMEIFQLRAKNAELELRKARLEQLLEDENLRKGMLENEEVYIQTKKYIEEKAKAIGYVYPDEIIFRKDE
ncbi:MAG: hypothetical protein IKF90_13950 [Parasporobacterium sp.]|nr:hypothetical protein [Parasporobacterium sp.]